MTKSPRRATKFKKLPHKETSTECALKKPPNIGRTLQRKRNSNTVSTATATFDAKITFQRAANSPNISLSAFAPSEPALSVGHHCQSILKRPDYNVTRLKQKGKKFENTPAEKIGTAATTIPPTLSFLV